MKSIDSNIISSRCRKAPTKIVPKPSEMKSIFFISHSKICYENNQKQKNCYN
jgi:hypothetical protein